MKTTKPISQWTKEECFAEVERLKCKTVSELVKTNNYLAKIIRTKGWIKDYPWESYIDCSNPPSNWPKEECFAEVKRLGCKTVKELQKTKNNLYKRMWKAGWIKDYPWESYLELNDSPSKWTKEQCFEFVRKSGCKTSKELEGYVPKGSQVITQMRKNNWVSDYPWDSYRGCVNNITVINSFIENIDFWEALTIPEILGIASAFGSASLMNKMLKKLAKSGPDSEERKFTLDSIKEMTDMTEDEALEEINKDEDDEVKENDMIEEMVKAAENMPSDEKEYQNELERIGKVMVGMERLQGNRDFMNIVNSGDVIKTLKESITKRILLLSFEHPQVFDELEQKYCK